MAGIYKSEAGREAVERHYRAMLNDWPVPRREVRVPTCHGDTFVVVSGDEGAPPVVLLHGSGTNASMWIRDIGEWAKHFRVHAVDLIGEPGFSAPSRPPFRSDAYAAWLDDVWNHFGLTRAAIVGVSLGGWIGLDYAVRRPDRVAALSLLSPSGIGAQNRLFLLKAGVLLMLGDRGLRRAMTLVARGVSLPRDVADSLALRFRHFRPRMDTLPIRTDEELAGLEMPVQVILGGRDVLLRSSETRDRVQRSVRDLHLTYLEHEGHIVPRSGAMALEFVMAHGRVARPFRAAAAARVVRSVRLQPDQENVRPSAFRRTSAASASSRTLR